MFEKVIAPILLYASEIWGAYTIIPSKSLLQDSISGYFKFAIERFYGSFLKYCLGVHRKACNIAVFGELGSTPISLKVMTMVCKNWFRIVNSEKNSLLSDTYLCNIEMAHGNQSVWVKSVKDILFETGFQELWHNQGNRSGIFPSKIFKRKLQSKFERQWGNDISEQNSDECKLRTYVKFKKQLKFEHYLDAVKNFQIRKNITRLRISAHNLYIETGRHKRPYKTPVNQRTCITCNSIDDELHFMLDCDQFKVPRNIMLNKLEEIFIDVKKYSKTQLFGFIMGLQDSELTKIVEKYIVKCIEIRGKSL